MTPRRSETISPTPATPLAAEVSTVDLLRFGVPEAVKFICCSLMTVLNRQHEQPLPYESQVLNGHEGED